MNLRCYCTPVLLLLVAVSLAEADDLTRAFKQAQELVRNSKPSSDRGSNQREERVSNSETRAERSQQQRDQEQDARLRAAREAERQAAREERERLRKEREDAERRAALEREKQRQRLERNLELLEKKLADARNAPRDQPSLAAHNGYDAKAVLERLQRLQSGMGNSQERRAVREAALKAAAITKAATAQRTQPRFQPLWDSYVYNRVIGYGLVPVENKCAIVMSMTLGFQPRDGEGSLHELGNKSLLAKLKTAIEAVRIDSSPQEGLKAEAGARYYIRAQELADRLISEWNAPRILDGPKMREEIAGKRGVIFFEDGYGVTGTGQHIDLWDSDHIATSATLPFSRAKKKVWFWEMQ